MEQQKYPLRACGVVPRFWRRNAKERNRGRFVAAVPVYRRRSVRAWISEEKFADGSLFMECQRALGAGSKPGGVKREGFIPTSGMVRVQFYGRVPA